jgi:hypothetical protein
VTSFGLRSSFTIVGRMSVVAQGAHAIEADGAEELLVEEAVLPVLEDGVPLVGDLAQGMVDRHGRRLERR